MIYILLRALLQTIFTQTVRHAQTRGGSVMGIVLINYGVATLLCLALASRDAPPGLSRPTLVYGVLGGITYLLALVLLLPAMRQSGVAISVAVLQLSVLLPVAHAMLVFGERPSPAQAVGLALAVVALIVLSFTTSAPSSSGVAFSPVLIPLFLVTGLSGIAMKSFQVEGPPREIMSFNAVLFGAATLSTLVVMLRRPGSPKAPRLTLGAVAAGCVMGIANTGQLACLMLALAHEPAILVFPVSSALSLVANAVVSLWLWGEWLRPAGWLGLGFALMASVLLNIGG